MNIKESRNERTRRLVQIGAIAEKYLQVNTPEKAEALGRMLSDDIELLTQLQKKAGIKA